jgi:UDPglucose 6-dehydrogenase
MARDRRSIIGFAGMTHLGLVSASVCASKGFRTVCFDGDAKLVAALQAGRLHVEEPDLAELVAANGSTQTFTSSASDLGQCDVVYISTDVPTDDEARSDLTPVRALIDRVMPALKADSVLVVLCQVPPGFTRSLARAQAGPTYYQVETLIFGRAVERAALPERYIVGCDDPTKPLAPAFAELLGAYGCPILPMRYESAELAKISINFCLVASIGVANTLAELSEKVGADWSEIVPALKLDRRIGQWSYLTPGLGIAGGNLERDLRTVLDLSNRLDTDSGIVQAWTANSRHRRAWALDRIKSSVLDKMKAPTIAVWGLAYKENTHSIKNSPSLFTIERLPQTRIVVHDPVVPASAARHAGVEAAGDPLAAVAGADALMILTPWPQYRDVAVAEIVSKMRGRVIIDPFAVLDGHQVATAGIEYHTLGKGVTKAG